MSFALRQLQYFMAVAYPAVQVTAIEDNRDYLEHLLVGGWVEGRG